MFLIAFLAALFLGAHASDSLPGVSGGAPPHHGGVHGNSISGGGPAESIPGISGG